MVIELVARILFCFMFNHTDANRLNFKNPVCEHHWDDTWSETRFPDFFIARSSLSSCLHSGAQMLWELNFLELLNKISIFSINNTLRSGVFASRQ